MNEHDSQGDPSLNSENNSPGPKASDRGLTRQDLRRFGTVTAVLVAMLFLALANKGRRELRRQGEPSNRPSKYQLKAKPIQQFKLKLSPADMKAPDGTALSDPVDMIIRDRENVHQKANRDPEDELDPFFTTPKKRAHWQAIMYVDPAVKKAVQTGHPTVLVSVFPQRLTVRLVR